MKATELLKNEPVKVGMAATGIGQLAVIGELLPAVYAALASYGVEITPELQALITALVLLVAPYVAGLVIRQFTSPAWKLEDARKSQFRAPGPGD